MSVAAAWVVHSGRLQLEVAAGQTEPNNQLRDKYHIKNDFYFEESPALSVFSIQQACCDVNPTATCV